MKNEMTAFAMFALNYDHDFIEQVWGKHHLYRHIQAKWSNICTVMGSPTESYGRLTKLWSELSDEHRDKLSEFIRAKYMKVEPTKEEQERAEVIELARMRSLLPSYSGCSVHVCINGKGQPYIDDFYDPSCIATFVNGIKQ